MHDDTSLTLLEDDGQTWPAQGDWTYEDCLRLPEDGQRYEVLRGVLYVTPSPIYREAESRSTGWSPPSPARW
jgi:hypothetical protein